MAAPDISAIVPIVLPRDMVRSVFPINQSAPLPALSALPDMVWRWNYLSAPGTPVTVTYGYSSTAPSYDPGGNVAAVPNYAAFNAEEKANIAAVLKAYAAVAGISFQGASAGSAQIVFRKADLTGASGFAFFPPHSNALSDPVFAGDAYFEDTIAAQPYIVFHELGHALGIGHAFDAGRPNPEDYGFDGGRYLSVVDQRAVLKPYYVVGNSVTQLFHPTTPMPLDILALQMLYGQNTTTRATNTTYKYDVNPSFFQTIWDAGGIDTIDVSNQVNPNIISLVDGSYSSIGLRDPFAGLEPFMIEFALSLHSEDQYVDGSNMLAIAFDAVIENAKGGSAGDRLIGNAVANQLTGNGGNDTMTGGGGVDTMKGGTGDDTYVVNLVADGLGSYKLEDVVSEALSQGEDTLEVSVNFTLPAAHTVILGNNLENLRLFDGTGAPDDVAWLLSAKGNGLNNRIWGNAAANVLTGGAGNDTMMGAGGNDTYVVSDVGDLVDEIGSGIDVVKASISYALTANVEKLTLTGTSGNSGTGNDLGNNLTGNSGANALSGGGGVDSILGKDGADILTGGAGADRFYFDTTPNAGNIDLIMDFSAIDRIYLDDDKYANVGPVGTLAASALGLGASAATAEQRVIYDASNGGLYYDPDGLGAAAQVQFATLDAGSRPATLANTNFVVVA